MTFLIFLICILILGFIIYYRFGDRKKTNKFITETATKVYEQYVPYSFRKVREKVKELGQEYSARQYAIQIIAFAGGAALLSFLYFYSIIVSIVYAALAILIVPYLTYLRCNRVYSEFIFEQIQVYTTNTIMEFAVTQSFVKSLEGVYSSNVLEDPIKEDVKAMIDMAYENGTIDASIEYMNSKYDYFIVRNMHQLFYQITTEGSKDAGESLENMSLDIDMLVESVYRDRADRASFHKKFLQFGMLLYLMTLIVQMLLGNEDYRNLLNTDIYSVVILHAILIINTFFLIKGEKYYNENVGAE